MGLKNKAKKSGAFRTLLKKLTEKDEEKKKREMDEEKPSRSGFRNATKQLKKLEKKDK